MIERVEKLENVELEPVLICFDHAIHTPSLYLDPIIVNELFMLKILIESYIVHRIICVMCHREEELNNEIFPIIICTSLYLIVYFSWAYPSFSDLF